MIEDAYKLHPPPFRLAPDPRFFYASETHSKALSYLDYGLQQGEGFVVLTGDVGTGKSMLIAHLLDRLPSERVIAVPIVISSLEAHDALRMIVTALGLQPAGDNKGALLAAIQEFLARLGRQGRKVLLLIDEAQNLPPETLEELRMLTNLQAEGEHPLQCFLIGQPQFREILARPDLEQLRQRVIASHHLAPLSLAETSRYLEHRMRVAGWTGRPTFAESVIPLVHEASGGIPRRINLLVSRLLLLGALEGLDHLDESAARLAIADLEAEAGPPPRQTPAPSASMGAARGDVDRDLAALASRVDAIETMLLETLHIVTTSLQSRREKTGDAEATDDDETTKPGAHD